MYLTWTKDCGDYKMIYDSVVDLIGNTPLVKIRKLNPNPHVQILAKLEYFNPSGSIKDRIAKWMIEKAEEMGLLSKDKIIIEPTSGNTGIAISMVGAAKGYKVIIILPRNVTKERVNIIRSYGADIVFTDTEKDAIFLAKKMAKEHPEKYVLLNQFENQANIEAHYKTTAREIWRDTNGNVDYIVVGIGTAGTIMGIAKFFKEKKPTTKIIGVYPEIDYEVDGCINPRIYQQPLLKPEFIDEFIPVSREEALSTMCQLIRKEGIFAGISSGATIFVALQKARKIERGTIVAICADSADRYFSVLSSLIQEREKTLLVGAKDIRR